MVNPDKKPLDTTPPPSKWGGISLADAVATILPAGTYPATITESAVVENENSQFIRITFEVVTADGEIVQPDALWLLVATVAKDRTASLRQGLVMLSKIAAALDVNMDGMTAEDIAATLISRKVAVVVAATGTGVARKNVVRNVQPVSP